MDYSKSPEDIVRCYERKKGDRQNWESYWQAVADFFDINRATFVTKRSPGERRTKHLFDSTGLKASSELAAIIHSVVTNPANKWIAGEYDSAFMRTASDDSKQWLENGVTTMFDAINDSNFNIEVTTCYKDKANFGSALLSMEPAPMRNGEWNGVEFRAVYLEEICIELDAKGDMIGYYREHILTKKQAQLKWPDANITDEMERTDGQKDATATQGAEKKIEFIEYTCLRSPRALMEFDPTVPSLPGKRPYLRTIITKRSKTKIIEEGLYRLGMYMFTWDRAPGEDYGRGLGFSALPDMRTLNEVVRMDLEATAMRIKPPLKTRYNNVVGDVRLIPGGLTICRDPAGLIPFEMGINVSESKLRIDDLRKSVRSIFLLDKLALPPRDQVGEMTMFEIRRRIQEMNQVMGPVLARMDKTLRSICEDLFFMMLRSGALGEMPDEIRENGALIRLRFMNPLTRAQKAEEMEAVQLWLNDLMALANAGKPEALDLIDDDQLARGIAETRGVPQSYITDKERVKEIRDTRQKQAQEAHAADVNAKNADAEYKRQSGAPDGGRPAGQ